MINEAAVNSSSYKKMVEVVRGNWSEMKDPDVQEVKSGGDFSIDETHGELLIYRHGLLVPPKEVRKDILKLAHAAHQSDNAMWLTTKQVWW